MDVTKKEFDILFGKYLKKLENDIKWLIPMYQLCANVTFDYDINDIILNLLSLYNHCPEYHNALMRYIPNMVLRYNENKNKKNNISILFVKGNIFILFD